MEESKEMLALLVALVLGVFKLFEWIIKQVFEKGKSYLTELQAKQLSEIHTIIIKDDGKGGSMILSTSQQNNFLLRENKETAKEMKEGLELVVKTQEKLIMALDGFLVQQKEQTSILQALKTDINIMSATFQTFANKIK